MSVASNWKSIIELSRIKYTPLGPIGSLPAGVTQLGLSGPSIVILNVLSNTPTVVLALITNTLDFDLATSYGVPTMALFSTLHPAGSSPEITVVVKLASPETGKL